MATPAASRLRRDVEVGHGWRLGKTGAVLGLQKVERLEI
jgi:hypothetical protein